jgi:integrase/recombinase XerC
MHVERTDGSYRIAGGSPVVGELANGFLSHLAVRAFSPLTIRAYAFHVLSFLRFCDEQNLALASVTPMDVFDFLDWLAKPAAGNVVDLRTGRGAAASRLSDGVCNRA